MFHGLFFFPGLVFHSIPSYDFTALWRFTGFYYYFYFYFRGGGGGVIGLDENFLVTVPPVRLDLTGTGFCLNMFDFQTVGLNVFVPLDLKRCFPETSSEIF